MINKQQQGNIIHKQIDYMQLLTKLNWQRKNCPSSNFDRASSNLSRAAPDTKQVLYTSVLKHLTFFAQVDDRS